MMVTNRETFGHLVNPETFDLTRKHPEVYQIIENRYDWELRYIHPDFADSLKPDAKIEQVRLVSILATIRAVRCAVSRSSRLCRAGGTQCNLSIQGVSHRAESS